MHAVVEEEIFYPAVREHVGAQLMNEADEEHHVARVLIAELDNDGRNDHRDAKFTVLAESIRHHIKEEEGEMLPKAKELDIDFIALGQQILTRKKEMRQKGIPSDAEHTMVSTVSADTPAKASRTRHVTGRKRSASRHAGKKIARTSARRSSPRRVPQK
jgi:hypothetical protein